MQTSIKELEHLSTGLQDELQSKEELYEVLKSDYTRLEMKFTEVIESTEKEAESKAQGSFK